MKSSRYRFIVNAWVRADKRPTAAARSENPTIRGAASKAYKSLYFVNARLIIRPAPVFDKQAKVHKSGLTYRGRGPGT
jgi:hypothetical protein